MDKLDEYLVKQKQEFEKLRKKNLLIQEIKKNVEETNFCDDNELRLHNAFERHSMPLWGKGDERKSSDPVIAKLGEIASTEGLRNSGYPGLIRGLIYNTYFADISWRKMDQETYQYLLETPKEDLISSWDQEFRVKYNKTG